MNEESCELCDLRDLCEISINLPKYCPFNENASQDEIMDSVCDELEEMLTEFDKEL